MAPVIHLCARIPVSVSDCAGGNSRQARPRWSSFYRRQGTHLQRWNHQATGARWFASACGGQRKEIGWREWRFLKSITYADSITKFVRFSPPLPTLTEQRSKYLCRSLSVCTFGVPLCVSAEVDSPGIGIESSRRHDVNW
jgi:hypothetical protein